MSHDPTWPYFKYDYPRSAEWVPTATMWALREYDRRLDPGGAQRVSAIESSLRYWGFTAPVIITYHQDERTVLLGEGNHRVAAAMQAGLPFVLARVWRISSYPGKRHRTSRAPVPVRGVEPNRDGYVKADLTPSEVGIEGCRKLSAVEIALDGTRVPGVPVPDWAKEE